MIISLALPNLPVAQAATPKKVVIFVPGIMGTELWKDEARESDLVWMDPKVWKQPGFEFGYLNYDKYDLYPNLPLGWPGSQSHYWHDKLFSPGFLSALDSYNKICEYLTDKGYDVIPFGYDWRDSNYVSANKLKRTIEDVIDTKGVSKVDIVAHSMGGLVSKQYIIDNNGKYVDHFITMGTPFFGSPQAFQFLKTGYSLAGPVKASKSTIRTIPSIYELLPSSNYYTKNGKGYLGETESEITLYGYGGYVYSSESTKETTVWSKATADSFIRNNVDHNNEIIGSLYDSAEKFHDWQTADVSDSLDNPNHFYRIIGDSQPTTAYYYVDTYSINGKQGKKKRLLSKEANGDGTVPMSGAAPGASNTWYVSEDHGNIPSNSDALDAVDDILNGRSVSLRTTPKSIDASKITIYKSVEDPLTIQAFAAPQASDASSGSGDIWQETFEPRIELTYADGSQFLMDHGVILSNPRNIQVGDQGATIDLYPDSSESLTLHVSSPAGEEMGMMVTRYADGQSAGMVDYIEADLQAGDWIASFANGQVQQAGLDTDRNGSPDRIFDGIQGGSNPPTDPGDPGDPGDGSISIDINGTAGDNRWLKSPASISLATTLEVPVPSEPGEGSEPDPADEAKQPAELFYAIDGAGESAYSGSFTYSTDGKHTIRVTAKDLEGKVVGEASKSFKIDQVTPALNTGISAEAGDNGWYVTDAQVSVGSSDATSKLAAVRLGIDTAPTSYGGPVWVRDEGRHQIGADAKDNAGWLSSQTTELKLDKTKSVVESVYLQDEYYVGEEFPIRFTAYDRVSGIASVTATINGDPVTNGQTYRFTQPGWHQYRISVKDEAGWSAVFETKFEVYIPARIDFDPDHLQLDHGQGNATMFIQLPAAFDPKNIRFDTVELDDHVAHIQDDGYGYVKNPYGDHDADGIEDMMLKYDRPNLVDVIPPQSPVDNQDNPNAPDWSNTRLVVYGDWGPYHFKGYDSIIVTNKAYTPPPPDVTPPAVQSDPLAGAADVSKDVSPLLTFDEPIRLRGGDRISDTLLPSLIVLTDSNGNPVPFTATWDQNENQIQVNPTHRLEPGETYRLEIPAGTFADLSGNPNALFTTEWVTNNSRPVLPSTLPMPVIELESPSGEGISNPPSDPVPPSDPNSEPENVGQTSFMSQASPLPEAFRNDQTALLSDDVLNEAINRSADGSGIRLLTDKPTLVLSKSQLQSLSRQSTFTIRWPHAEMTVNTADLPRDADYIGWTGENRQWPKSQSEMARKKWLAVSDIIHVEESVWRRDKGMQKEAVAASEATLRLPIPNEVHAAARNGTLQMAHYDEATGTWTSVQGEFNETSGDYRLSTRALGDWCWLVPRETFGDVANHWAKSDIEKLASFGILKGEGAGFFSPNAKVTRAEFVAMLSRIYPEAATGESQNFSDVPSDGWYAAPVQAAYRNGWILGDGDGRFHPEDAVSREEMAVVLIRVAHSEGIELTFDAESRSFADSNAISEWASEAIARLTQAGILQGKKTKSGFVLDPQAPLTRAEAAKLLNELLLLH